MNFIPILPSKFSFRDVGVSKVVQHLADVEEAEVVIIDRANYFKRFVGVCKRLVDESRLPKKYVVNITDKYSGTRSSTACRFKASGGTITMNVVYGRAGNVDEHLRLIVEPGVMIDIRYDGGRLISVKSSMFEDDKKQIAQALGELSELARQFLKENTTNVIKQKVRSTPSLEKMGSF